MATWPLRLCLAFLITATIAILFMLDPEQTNWFPPCIFHKLTSFDCPGCGSARGMHSLLHGNLVDAADHNLLLIPALPVLAIGIVHSWSGKAAGAWNYVNKPRLILWIVLAFWVLRNLPWQPFSWLAAGI